MVWRSERDAEVREAVRVAPCGDPGPFLRSTAETERPGVPQMLPECFHTGAHIVIGGAGTIDSVYKSDEQIIEGGRLRTIKRLGAGDYAAVLAQ